MKRWYLLVISVISIGLISCRSYKFGLYDYEKTLAEKNADKASERKFVHDGSLKRIKSVTGLVEQNGKKWTSYIQKFYPSGTVESYTTFKKNGHQKYRYEYAWNDSFNITRENWLKNGKLLHADTIKYDPTGANRVEFLSKNSRGKTINHVFYAYNALGLEKEFRSMKKGDKKMWYRYEYDYYPDGSKKESRWYNHSNKLKYVRKYNCNDVPLTQKEMLKDTTKLCVKYDFDNEGHKTKTVEEYDKHGKPTRRIFTYDMEGKLLGSRLINPKGKIIFKDEFQYDSRGNIVDYKNYKPGGSKLDYETVTVYDDQGNTVKRERTEDGKTTVYTFVTEKW